MSVSRVTPTESHSGGTGLRRHLYSGKATITLSTYDYCGPGSQREFTGSTTYTRNANLELEAPKTDGSQVESNPFSLFFNAGPAAALGDISVESALVVNEPNPLLLTYWRLHYRRHRLTGTLTDTHAQESAVENLFDEYRLLVPCRPELGALPPWPSPLAEGATLAAKVYAHKAHLTLKAATTDGLIAFTLHFAN